MDQCFIEKLNFEESENISGKLLHIGSIKHLKETNYHVFPDILDGDAPKQLIKAYFYEKNSRTKKRKVNSWNLYIAKSAEKWYPHESVIEFLINRIGQVLGLKMNHIKLVEANAQIRFLSEYFLTPSKEVLIHGAEICGEYLEDEAFAKEIAIDKNSARELFTFEFIRDAMKSVFPKHFESLLVELVKLIVYDAITGNNDRHFYNWGVIRSIRRSKQAPYFSPIYDSSRGFLWNWSDVNLIKHYKNHHQGGKKVEKYIDLASPRISTESDSEINHFGLVAHIWSKYPEYQETIMDLISLDCERNILKMYTKEFSKFFIYERNELFKLIVNRRFCILREMAN